MSTNEVGEDEAQAALDAVTQRLKEKIAPKLGRLREAKGRARELRAEVADLNKAVAELAEEVSEVKQAVKAVRRKRAASTGGSED